MDVMSRHVERSRAAIWISFENWLCLGHVRNILQGFLDPKYGYRENQVFMVCGTTLTCHIWLDITTEQIHYNRFFTTHIHKFSSIAWPHYQANTLHLITDLTSLLRKSITFAHQQETQTEITFDVIYLMRYIAHVDIICDVISMWCCNLQYIEI